MAAWTSELISSWMIERWHSRQDWHPGCMRIFYAN
jgi:hypothetical protein